MLKLRELARNPYDLSSKDAVNPGRISSMQTSTCGLKMLYGTERVDDKIMEALVELAKDRAVMPKLRARSCLHDPLPSPDLPPRD